MVRALSNHSFSNLDEVAFTHLHWDLTIDFAHKLLRASAEYTFTLTPEAAAKESPVIVLDTNHLEIEAVYVDGEEASYELQAAHKVFGRPLVVDVTKHSSKVRVEYTTTTESSGLQWLPKELTAGKEHPYLFTQCQAIHARTIVPSPDTPSAKFTYSAHVTVPEWCTALMSAISVKSSEKGLTRPRAKKAAGTSVFSFRQDVPIPSYLLAIAAGKMESKELGPRSRVWAEPSVVAKAAHEFSQTEEFLTHAEEITGQEYVWKRYDLVCLPPSFPYGGMENPCLTFVTPTLLAGDRSLADVVAHEISHSWTGNLVTNHSWTDFWLNEGWTMWLERKIQTRIYNDPLAYDLKATMGLRDLVESVNDFGPTHPFTHLVPNVDGVDPDEVFSSIPYEKGFNFLNYLKDLVGGHDVFDAFAKAYIGEFKFKTLTSAQFKAFFIKYFTETVDKKKAIAQVDWETWFHAPGMPPVEAKFDTTRTTQAITLGDHIMRSADAATWEAAGVTANMLKKWPASLWILMLDTLLLHQAKEPSEKQSSGIVGQLSPTHLDAIDAFCHKHLTTTHNAELRFRWFTLSLRAQDLRVLDKTILFLQEQGRMKYVRPLFRDLCKAVGPAQTASIFASSKSMYHPIAAKMIQRDIDEAAAAASKKSGGSTSSTTTTTAGGKKTIITTTTTTTSSSNGGKPVKTVKTTTTATSDSASSSSQQEVDLNLRLAKFLHMPTKYAAYSPVAAMTLSAAVVAVAVILAKRR